MDLSATKVDSATYPITDQGRSVTSATLVILSQRERTFMALHQQARAAVGLPAYGWYPPLTRLAMERNTEMISGGYGFSHNAPDGSLVFVSLLKAVGIDNYQWAGENLALIGMTDIDPDTQAKHAFDALMASPGHKANILDSDFNRFAVAAGTGPNGSVYWTTIFLTL